MKRRASHRVRDLPPPSPQRAVVHDRYAECVPVRYLCRGCSIGRMRTGNVRREGGARGGKAVGHATRGSGGDQ
ncbi:hypothetical protein BD779DRAFT_1531630 [Infundibulicybe gibba]|nr:hypothetical protein BD779DRAFT_1540151 [Infundibulicybe gibba]KAF8885942.1 hypothetical protein BD779DRAFT_1531630 [Infundibulicybe gibba]